MNEQQGFTTRILHSDRLSKPEHGALHQPVHNSVTRGYEAVEDLVNVFQNKTKGYAYSRQGNPTVAALEHKITQMEMGLATVAFGTGMAAVTATLLSLLKAGDHVIASSFLFGNTRDLNVSFHESTSTLQWCPCVWRPRPFPQAYPTLGMKRRNNGFARHKRFRLWHSFKKSPGKQDGRDGQSSQ